MSIWIPLAPSVFNSRRALSGTGLGWPFSPSVLPSSRPPKWQDVWHTFPIAKGVDNSMWGSNMAKIEPTPKGHWTPASFHVSPFSHSPRKESLWKALPFINYPVNANIPIYFSSARGGVVTETPTTLNGHDRQRNCHVNRRASTQGGLERRTRLFQMEKMRRTFGGERGICAKAERHLLKLEGVGGVPGMWWEGDKQ